MGVPIVEARTVASFALTVAKLELAVEAAVVLVSVNCLLVIAIVDFDTQYILCVLVAPGTIISLAR